MGINVERGGYIGVSEPVLQLFGIPSFVDQEGRACVPEFVQCNFRSSECGCCFFLTKRKCSLGHKYARLPM